MAETGEDLAGAVREAGEAFASFIAGLSDEAFHRRPAAEEWSAAELAGHAAEFPVTFAKQAAELAVQPGTRLGRQLDAPGRLAAIERLQGARPVEAAALVLAAAGEAATLLAGISPEGWDAEGARVVNGESITARALVETFVLGHLRLHLAQARAAAKASE